VHIRLFFNAGPTFSCPAGDGMGRQFQFSGRQTAKQKESEMLARTSTTKIGKKQGKEHGIKECQSANG
jgi:hypothetical protein